jgi:predicted nucleotidyltransferase
MKPSEALSLHRHRIRPIVERHNAGNARIFGSVLRGKDTEDSDLDILVDPYASATLMDIAAIQVELERLLGIPVDVLTPDALPDRFRSQVLSEAEPI